MVTPLSVPAQRVFLGSQPDLNGLRGDGADVRRHVLPCRLVDGEFAGDDSDHPDGHGEHDMVEILASLQYALLDVAAIPEVRFQAVDSVSGLDLVEQRSVRKHRQTANCRQRFVVFDAVGEANLPAHGDRVDGLTTCVQMQSVDAMEELELHAAAPKCLIQRGDHDIAHACRHLPEDRPAVLEERYADEEDRGPGAHRGSIVVSVLVAEYEVVQSAHQREVHDVGVGAMAQHPFGEVLVVDRPEAAADGWRGCPR